MAEAVTAHEITVVRVLDAPREEVWKAWTEPDELACWWGPRGWSTAPSDVTIDVRPGGIMRVRSVSDDDGAEMITTGVFREVTEPERLAFEESSEDAWHEGADSVVTFSDLGAGRTEMVLRSTIHTTDEMRAQAEAGLRSAVDRLAALLS
jgi:uncharacterized protein YndB with AHSA1/START domain